MMTEKPRFLLSAYLLGSRWLTREAINVALAFAADILRGKIVD